MSRFDLGKFKPPPDEEFICGICRNVLDDPKESPCRHVFCQVCIKRALQEKLSCPICRTPCRERNLRSVLPLVQNLLNKLLMECDHFDKGCHSPIQMERFITHIAECGYMEVTCKNSPCKKTLLKRDCEEHETNMCEFRTIRCDKGCDGLVVFTKREEHNCMDSLKSFSLALMEENAALKKELEELQSMISSKRKLQTIKDNSSSSDNNGGESRGSEESYWHYNDSPFVSLSSPGSFTMHSHGSDNASIMVSDASNSSEASPVLPDDCSDNDNSDHDVGYVNEEDVWGSAPESNLDEDDHRHDYNEDHNEVGYGDVESYEPYTPPLPPSPEPDQQLDNGHGSNPYSHLSEVIPISPNVEFTVTSHRSEDGNMSAVYSGGAFQDFSGSVSSYSRLGANDEGLYTRDMAPPMLQSLQSHSGNDADSDSDSVGIGGPLAKRRRLTTIDYQSVRNNDNDRVSFSHGGSHGTSSSSDSLRRSSRLRNIAASPVPISIEDLAPISTTSYLLNLYANDSSSSDGSWFPSTDSSP